MSPTTQCQAVGETACTETPAFTVPVSLCEEHALQVSLRVVPGLLSRRLAETRSRSAGETAVLSPSAARAVSDAVSVSIPKSGSHPPLVYFLANGGRVKIGQTCSLHNRIRSLSLRVDAVVLLLDGGEELERALHAKFAAHRSGNTEWFEFAPEVIRFIADKDPQRIPKALTSGNASGRGHREAACTVIRALYTTLERRPLEGEMVNALRRVGLPASRQFANARRLELETADPTLATPSPLASN